MIRSLRRLSSRFALRRVVPCHDDGLDVQEREAVWLLIEWPDGEQAPTDFTFATMPLNTTKKQLVRIVKERYRTERVYEDRYLDTTPLAGSAPRGGAAPASPPAGNTSAA